MKTALFFLVFMTGSLVLGQSAKRLNKIYSVTLDLEKQEQDSSLADFNQAKRAYNAIRSHTTEKISVLREEEKLVLKLWFDFLKMSTQLSCIYQLLSIELEQKGGVCEETDGRLPRM